MQPSYLISTIFLISGCHISFQNPDNWGYSEKNGPEKWQRQCKTGKRQSPINIISDDTTEKDLESLQFVGYDSFHAAMLTNNGHTVEIKLSGVPVVLSGGGLERIYVLGQMHFHWGAEHTIDGTRDALELHLVHYNEKYNNISVAMQHENGISVVAVLFKLSDEDNKDLQPILESAHQVSQWVGGPSSVEIERKIKPMLLIPKDQRSFFRYEGSLTTPGCQEIVTWFVLTEKLKVSQFQLQSLKNITNGEGKVIFNYRPTQDVGERKIYRNSLGYSSSPPTTLPMLKYMVFAFISCLLVIILAIYLVYNRLN